MARASAAARLAAYQRSYRELAEQVADIGFIAAGTITRRHTRCGKPGCRCQAEPPQPHGPYHQWTGKINGKTVTRRLTEAKPISTRSGSLTIGRYVPSSPRCARSLPKPSS